MGSNLPPGVTEGMIPGNRPEDMEIEQFLDVITMKIDEGLKNATYLDERDVPDLLRLLIMEYEGE